MKQFVLMCSESVKELKKTQNMVLCALIAAIAVILSYTTTIEIGPYIKLGLSQIPNQVVSYLFGPIVGGVFGGMLDVLKFIIRPTGPYFIGFTLSEILSGMIYGLFLYKKPINLKRIAIAGLLDKVIVNCGLNTLWLSVLYGKGFAILLAARIVKNLVMWPIDSLIIFILLTYVVKIIKPIQGKVSFNK